MNIIAVDDDLSALEALDRSIRMAEPRAATALFDSSGQALEYAKKNRIDAAFLDIDMGEMNGLFLARHLKELYSGTNIIFVTGFMQYAIDAFEVRASGYVGKPIDPLRVRAELDNLRNPPDDGKGKRIERVGPYTLEYEARRVFRDGEDALLTPREYAIFHFLSSNPNTFFAPQTLYEKTVGLNLNGDAGSLYQHISRLRKRLRLDDAEAAGGIRIEQKRGKGYRLVVP